MQARWPGRRSRRRAGTQWIWTGAGRAVRVPAGVQLDLGATAKAYAADRAAAAIASVTGTGVLVNLGGDIAVAGDPQAAGWRVEIADGWHRPGPVVAIRDGGLATSATGARTWLRGGRRLHHIVRRRLLAGQPAPAGPR